MKIMAVKNQPAKSLLTPDDCALVLIDHQPQMVFGMANIDRQLLINNVVGLAKAAKIFKIPTILTTIAAKTFSGPILAGLQEIFPGQTPIDRTSMNAWEDERVVAAVQKTGRQKLVMAALWTEVCLAFPALSAQDAGFQVYAVADASGGTSVQVHDTAMQRLIQAGVTPVTWLQVLLEWQRDWARQETYDSVLKVIEEHGGAYGQGLVYAKAMLGGHEGG
jgi:nicotinamidase-related amidase